MRWLEVIPITDITVVETVTHAFLSRWESVFVFGAPSTISTDRGCQSPFFSTHLSNYWRVSIFRLPHIILHNGLVEHFPNQLKASLKTHANPRWSENVALVMLGIQTAIKSDLGCLMVELAVGTTMRLPRQFVAPSMDNCELDPNSYVHQLIRYMSGLRAFPMRTQSTPLQVHPDRATCTHIFHRWQVTHISRV